MSDIDVDNPITHAFNTGDCWHLAHYIVNNYADFELAYVYFQPRGTDSWFHAVAKRISAGTYVDINGEHSEQELLSLWDVCFDYDDWETGYWDETVPEENTITTNYHIIPPPRKYTIPIMTGIEHIINKGIIL